MTYDHLAQYANNPLAASLDKQLTRRVAEHCRQVLPEALMPSRLVVVVDWPLNANGKVDVKALMTMSSQLSRLTAASDHYTAPQTPMEEQLCEMWQDLLSVSRVGRSDNFFDLGGHSLLAVQLVTEIHQCWQVNLPVKAVFEQQTVASLTPLIAAAEYSQMPVLAPKPVAAANHLSYAQQRLWLVDQINPHSRQYHVPIALELAGRLNVKALDDALQAIVERHEVLRSVIRVEQGDALQISEPAGSVIRFIDLSGLEPTQQAQSLAHQLQEEATLAFDLSRDRMVRGRCLCLSSQRHVLALTLHHIAFDGWSKAVLVKELSALYRAKSSGGVADLPELEIQYKDYAYWQRQWLQGEVLAHHLDYWRQQLAGLPQVHELPLDQPGRVEQSFDSGRHQQQLPARVHSGLQALARSQNASLFMALNAAFGVLLGRYSGQTDIVVGTPVANREHSALAPLVGFFVNTLVIRNDLSGDPSFLDLLRRTRTLLLDAYAHQSLPFEKLVDELQPQRNLTHTPLFQVMLVLQNTADADLDLPGLKVTPLAQQAPQAKYDITLNIAPGASGLTLQWDYTSDLFHRRTIERMAANFAVLLDGILEKPQCAIGSLPLLTADQRAQLLSTNRHTVVDYPRERCLHEVFEARVEQNPDAPALVFEGKRLSYQQLNIRANQVAHALIAQGVKPDQRVGLCVERSLEMLVGLLGILKVGAAYVPLDPAYPEARLAYMFADAGFRVVLTQTALEPQLPSWQGQILYLDQSSPWDAQPQHNIDVTEVGVCATHLAYVMYTSGSTGQPKGVMVEHRAVMAFIENNDYLDADKVGQIASLTSFSFDLFVFDVFTALSNGACLHLLDPTMALDTERLADYLQAQQIDTFLISTALFNVIAQSPALSRINVQHILFGGEAANTSLANQVLHQCPETRLTNVYGPTEAVVFATACSTTTPLAHWTIGTPINNNTVYVLSPQQRLCPVGVVGELYLGGDSLARGYLNKPEQTRELFIEHPLVNGERLYRTGDLVRWLADEDGNPLQLDYLGRVDDQVKLRGHRIQLQEITTLLLRHDAVINAAVLMQGQPARLVAYVVPKFQDMDKAILRNHLQQHLPDYMIPSAMVLLKSLPLTVNGKVDKHRLAQHLIIDRPAACQMQPETDTEKYLCILWRAVLGTANVDVLDNFFDIGGNSLLAAKVIDALRRQYDCQVPFRLLFEAQQLRALATAIDALVAAPADGGNNGANTKAGVSVLKLASGSKAPPLFCLHGAATYRGLARRLEGFQDVYALWLPEEEEALLAMAENLDKRLLNNRLLNTEAKARDYVEAIQQILPQGDYCLAGFSYAGVIALEAARHAGEQERAPQQLFLLDTMLPNMKDDDEAVSLGDTGVADVPTIERLMGVRQWVYAQALRRYQPQAMTAPVCQIQASDSLEGDNQRLSVYLPSDRQSYVVEADHFSILKPPAVVGLAEIIKHVLASR